MDTNERTAIATLEEWYLGEVAGERLFELLAEHAAEPAERLEWRELAKLESAVARRLAAELAALGVAVPDTRAATQRAEAAAAPFRGLRYADTTRRYAPHAAAALDRMRAQAAALPPRHAPLGALVVDHERVLVDTFRDAPDDPTAARRHVAAFLRALG